MARANLSTLALALCLPAIALACSCIFTSFESQVDNAEILLHVRVVSRSLIGDSSFGENYFKAYIIGRYRGCNIDEGQYIYLRSAISSATCGVNLLDGKEYLVSAISSGEYWQGIKVASIGLCGLNGEWSSLTAAQQSYLCDHREQCAPGHCTDYKGFKWGECTTTLGYGLVGGRCTQIKGCSDQGRILYRSQSDCEASCTRPTCDDLAPWNFGTCRRALGVGVVNGKCQTIGGCSSFGYRLWPSIQTCSSRCKPKASAGSGSCPSGQTVVSCLVDPCSVSRGCANGVRCEANYCGGCNAVWYDSSGQVAC